MYFGSCTSDLQCKYAAKVQGKFRIRKYFEEKIMLFFIVFYLQLHN